MAELSPGAPRKTESIPPWRDIRVLGVLAQLAFLILVITGLVWVANNVSQNMSTLGGSQFLCRDGTSNVRCAFDFLSLDSQFAISETLIPYDPSDSYSRALLVGALNTIKVAVFGIILATILGTLTGIARLSSNWLVSSVARWYVDIIRNTPLLLQLFFLFFVVILGFPSIQEAIQPFGLPIYFSQRGIDLPRLVYMPSFSTWLMFIGLGILLAYVVWRWLGRREMETERDQNRSVWALVAFLVVAVPGWFIASAMAADDQGFVAPESTGITEIAGLEQAVLTELGVDDLGDVGSELASGALTEEQVEAASVSVCTVENDPAGVNLTAELRRANVPYVIEASDDQAQSSALYAEGGCDIMTAARSVLAADLEAVAATMPSVIVPVREVPVRLSIPYIDGLNFVGGIKLSPNFAAILIGLTIYTGAFIAEIVRAGIQSVAKGQSEAARALGLSESQRLRLVVLPQALRVIIPPLTSQYLNLTKNSSLAIAVGYPDLWSTAYTTLNQSGRPIQVFIIVMGTYLAFSLLISFFLNWYNRRVALVER